MQVNESAALLSGMFEEAMKHAGIEVLPQTRHRCCVVWICIRLEATKATA